MLSICSLGQITKQMSSFLFCGLESLQLRTKVLRGRVPSVVKRRALVSLRATVILSFSIRKVCS